MQLPGSAFIDNDKQNLLLERLVENNRWEEAYSLVNKVSIDCLTIETMLYFIKLWKLSPRKPRELPVFLKHTWNKETWASLLHKKLDELDYVVNERERAIFCYTSVQEILASNNKEDGATKPILGTKNKTLKDLENLYYNKVKEIHQDIFKHLSILHDCLETLEEINNYYPGIWLGDRDIIQESIIINIRETEKIISNITDCFKTYGYIVYGNDGKLRIEKKENFLASINHLLTNRNETKPGRKWLFFLNNKPSQESVEEESVDNLLHLFRNSYILRINLKFLSLTGGEVFVFKDFLKLVKGLSDLRIPFVITTNGLFPGKLDTMLQQLSPSTSLKEIQVSVDGLSTTRDRIRKKYSYKSLLNSISIIKKYNIPVITTTTITHRNINHLGKIKEFFNNYSDNHVCNPLINGNVYDYSSEEIEKMKPFISPHMYKTIAHTPVNNNCKAGISRCTIDPIGGVWVCDTSSLWEGFKFGSISQYGYDFDTLWYSEEADQVRARISECPGCQNLYEQ